MNEPIPGQQQLLSIEATVPSTSPPGVIPRNRDIILTAEQIEEARREWPDKTEKQQLAFMRGRVRMQLGHSIIVDERTGRRALGGPQRTASQKKRIGQTISEAADERQNEIIDAAFSALDPKVDPAIRHKAAINITRIAREERELELKEDELERVSGEELAREAAKVVLELVRNGELSIEDIVGTPVDATVVE